MNSLLKTALLYAQKGWYVFPLKPGGKTPLGRLVPNGVKDATNVESTIKEWWTATPNANIGIATGASNLAVIDIDVKEGHNGEKSWAQLLAELQLKLPDTWVVTTPSGGRHIYYTTTETLSPSVGELGDGLDVRAGNSYVVAPPSTTSEGLYTPNRRLAFTTIAPPPSTLLLRLQKQMPVTPMEVSIIEDDALPVEVERAREALSRLAATRADNYADWLYVGMSLRELGTAGLTLWDDFSQKSDKYNKPDSSGRVGYAMVKHAWGGLQPTTGKPITLGSLYLWAADDSRAVEGRDNNTYEVKGGENGSTWAEMGKVIKGISYDWNRWLPRGLLTMIAAETEMGKSMLALHIARSYLTGSPWPDGTPFTREQGSVLWCEAESAQSINFDRARSWGLPLNRILTPFDDPLLDIILDDKQHRILIEKRAMYPDVTLVVVDSLSGGNSTTDENSSNMIRLVKWLGDLAKTCRKPVLLTHHLNKPPVVLDNKRVPLARVRGSSAIVQVPRVVWALDRPNPDSKSTRLSVIKSNLGAKPEPLGFTIDAEGLHFTHEAPKLPRNETLQDKAENLLETILQNGQVASNQIRQEFEEAGLSWNTAQKVKNKLKVLVTKQAGHWYWQMPRAEVQET